MKPSIAITLIIVIFIFSYVSGYSIGAHNKKAVTQGKSGQATVINKGTATAAEYKPAASGGYGQ